MERKYLFGDSDLAQQRLELLARVFEESTRDFVLEAAADRRWRLAVDLGCGPGFTTGLIVQSLRCDRVLEGTTRPRISSITRAAGSEGRFLPSMM